MKIVSRFHRLFAGLMLTLITVQPAAAAPLRILALGDSLTAGYGLAADEAFPVKLEAALKALGHDVTVINAGVSGDTASAGLARVDWAVGDGVDAAIVELGANDMLRGIDPRETAKAVDGVVATLTARKIPVLVAGMVAAPNLGEDYGRAFGAIFSEVAERHGALLYPFFLDGVVADARLNQADGIHPTAAGIDIIVARILPSVEHLIERANAAE